jgi:aminoglycoside phosphotransferase (APT) family kinase protein
MRDPRGFLTAPDGVEVVANAADARHLALPPLLVLDALLRYLDAQGIGEGTVSWKRIGDGQSNVTYLLRRGDISVVLRRGPRPPLPSSAHDMLREANVQRVLGAAGVAVPRILAVCADESVLGVPFYVMEFVDGHIITDTVPRPFASLENKRKLSELTVETLVGLHEIDVGGKPFSSLGRPDGYLQRQVSRFSELWPVYSTRVLPQVQELSRWLVAHLPVSRRASLVHGDYRLGNIMFASAGEPRVSALLDWEMATLGDPLADLGYLTATWSADGARPTPMELSPVTAMSGFLDAAGLVDHYVALTGIDATALPWYQALALWKSSIFSEAIYTRWLKGERPDDTTFAPTLETGVPRLLEAAAAFAGL